MQYRYQPFLLQLTLLMAVISSVFFHDHEKCQRLYNKPEVFCVYAVDIIMCFVIMLLLVPQILVVREMAACGCV